MDISAENQKEGLMILHNCFVVVIIKNNLLIVYYELQSISFADRVYRPVIDQLKYYYIVLIFYQIRNIDQPAYHQSVIRRV